MISALNFKSYDKGALRGFFDLRYHGLTIKGCRLMNGNNGLWIAFPQCQGQKDGEVKYFDQVYLAAPEMDHIRKLAIADLKAQGHFRAENRRRAPQRPDVRASTQGDEADRQRRITPEGEDLSAYYSPPTDEDNDIPF